MKKNNIKKLSILLVVMMTIFLSACTTKKEEIEENKEEEIVEEKRLIIGNERFEEYLPLLEGKRVALFTNQSGIVGFDMSKQIDDKVSFDQYPTEGEHILDVLLEKEVDVRLVFVPEHGFRGESDAGETVSDEIDPKTGIPIVSLYGQRDGHIGEEEADLFDVLVCDIQDLGVRFYTYYISMFKLMEDCARYDKTFIVLDRPDPNGFYVDGPILKEGYESEVGIIPIPVVYGMSIGELALMIEKEGWLSCGTGVLDLKVIGCLNYDHHMEIVLPCKPSPNIKDMRAVYLYPSLCFFENTLVSVGRGSGHPFEIYGSPYLKDEAGYDFVFVPEDMAGAYDPLFEGESCYGKDLRDLSKEELRKGIIDLEYLISTYQLIHESYPELSFFGEPDYYGRYWIDLLSGSDELRTMIIEGKDSDEIRESWKEDLTAFKELRSRYLIYPD